MQSCLSMATTLGSRLSAVELLSRRTAKHRLRLSVTTCKGRRSAEFSTLFKLPSAERRFSIRRRSNSLVSAASLTP